jgi:hypothetical protein
MSTDRDAVSTDIHGLCTFASTEDDFLCFHPGGAVKIGPHAAWRR